MRTRNQSRATDLCLQWVQMALKALWDLSLLEPLVVLSDPSAQCSQKVPVAPASQCLQGDLEVPGDLKVTNVSSSLPVVFCLEKSNF